MLHMHKCARLPYSSGTLRGTAPIYILIREYRSSSGCSSSSRIIFFGSGKTLAAVLKITKI